MTNMTNRSEELLAWIRGGFGPRPEVPVKLAEITISATRTKRGRRTYFTARVTCGLGFLDLASFPVSAGPMAALCAAEEAGRARAEATADLGTFLKQIGWEVRREHPVQPEGDLRRTTMNTQIIRAERRERDARSDFRETVKYLCHSPLFKRYSKKVRARAERRIGRMECR